MQVKTRPSNEKYSIDVNPPNIIHRKFNTGRLLGLITTTLPAGANASGINLKCWIPKGIPTRVRQQAAPVSALRIADWIPTNMIQKMLKIMPNVFFITLAPLLILSLLYNRYPIMSRLVCTKKKIPERRSGIFIFIII